MVRPKREVDGGPTQEEDEDTKEAEATGSGSKKDNRVRVVFITDGDKAVLRKVETGIADRDFIEIKSGLEPGEEIITGSYRALTRELKDGSGIERRKKGENKDQTKS